VARRVVDKHLLRLIKMWLKVPVEERDAEGRRQMRGGKANTHGTPQGGVISPLLANLYMHRFLKAWRDHGKGQQYRARIVNYADDFVILSRGHAPAALDWTRRVMGRIGLTLNEEKTCIRNGRREPFNFLGYTFGPLMNKRSGRRYLGAAPSTKAVQRLRERLRGILQRGNTAPWTDVVGKVNQILKGWQHYFSYGSLSRAYEAVNWAVLERVRYILRKRHRVSTQSMWRQFAAKTIYGSYGVHKLRRPQRKSTPCAAT